MTNQNQNTDPIRPDPIEDSDGKDDFTEEKRYIEEVHKVTVNGDLEAKVQYIVDKDSGLERFLDTILKTIAGRTDVGRIVGEGKDIAKYVLPYGEQIDALTDKIGQLARNELQSNNNDMEDSKPWYKSVTVNSIIAIIAIGASQFFGIELAEQELQNTIESVGMAIASLTALWGRIRAKTKIGKNKNG